MTFYDLDSFEYHTQYLDCDSSDSSDTIFVLGTQNVPFRFKVKVDVGKIFMNLAKK